MHAQLSRGVGMEHAGKQRYLGTQRVVLNNNNHYDAATQADIQHMAVSYESEDETIGRMHAKTRRALYSRQDILEQYCISERGMGALESDRRGFFSCLSSHQLSPCTRSSILTVCVQKVPSDENLHDLYRRPHTYHHPRKPRWEPPPPPEIYNYDEGLSSSYFRRKAHTDASSYQWMPSDDESVRMERPRSILDHHHGIHTTPHRTKHVSFARSHTLTSFDDAVVSLGASSVSNLSKSAGRSQERLIDIRRSLDRIIPITKQPELQDNVLVMEKHIRTPMKTQATQTEACLGRKPIAAGQMRGLSPRTVRRVKMVSQGAQTNGINANGRKLTKSFSEATGKEVQQLKHDEHEPIHRTLSDEPPRSPFVLPPDILPPLPSDSSSRSEASEESESKKEIIIDFKPQLSQLKKPLAKTASDGDMLERKTLQEASFTSASHEDIMRVEEIAPKYAKYLKPGPIRHEGIFKLEDHVFSSIDEENGSNGIHPQDSIDEVFHENYIYEGKYLKVEGSSTSEEPELKKDDQEEDADAEEEEEEEEEEDEGVVPTSYYLRSEDKSPFVSSDSLATDLKDTSDGIWNESQVTVLQADSDNGGASSELATSPISTVRLLTPSSRRKHMLMLQHQQRSSMDTEILDEESPEQLVQAGPSMVKKVVIETPSISSTTLRATEGKHFLQLRKKSPPVYEKKKKAERESPPQSVPDLARTDSGRTTTDVSESTTTDDYITANSTDSSRRSTSRVGEKATRPAAPAPAQEGSSFESQSSIYSVTKGDFLADDMIVPSFTPPPTLDESMELAAATATVTTVTVTPIPERPHRRRRTSPTGSSSSSGSYSLDGTPELPQRPPVPSPKHMPSMSEDERSAHYSSSGYYDSPLDDDTTWRAPEEEVQKAKAKAEAGPAPRKVSPSKELLRPQMKQRRVRTRSPMQTQQRKAQQMKKSPVTETRAVEERAKALALTSDESINLESPVKSSKKGRDKGRKSPVRARKSSIDDKASTLPSTSRKKSRDEGLAVKRSSPDISPSKRKTASPEEPSTTGLKALSAESLRSVSPGSDSVFYSDPSSHTADQHVHCLHCGKEVDIVTTDDMEKSASQPDIVQPPEGFADSPRAKPAGRLFKKFEKRFRSEDRSHDRRHFRYRSEGLRAKSEEREKSEKSRVMRPMARSREHSLEGLRATDSSPCVLPAAPEDEDDLGVYNVPYLDSSWIYIDDETTWSRPGSAGRVRGEDVWVPRLDAAPAVAADEEAAYGGTARRDSTSSVGSTESEREFKKRYQAVTHRMVHRKSCLEMYKRQASKSFAPESTTGEHESLRKNLEELLKLMLVVWCKQNEALKVITSKGNESDKTVVVRRVSGEFGFRIHGSKPVVVSAIEPETPAETSGLEVGDIVLAVNGISVLDKSHSEVVKIAHAGSDTLTLEVARTSSVLSPTSGEIYGGAALFCGYLWKLGGHASGTPSTKWVRRWFSLKKDNCLYYYKTDLDKQPVGAMMLMNYEILRAEDNAEGPSRAFRFCLRLPGVATLHLAADTEQARCRWLEVMIRAADEGQIVDVWLEQTRRDLTLPPSQIRRPDCFGYLVKLGNQWKSWSRRYCVLKDACLYFYQDANAKSAFGVACLHGYRVQQTSSVNKKHAFEIIPADPNQKHFYFHTESDMDRKRWLAALEYSIDRWLKVG